MCYSILILLPIWSNMEFDYQQRQSLLKRFPDFELSYETMLHKKVEPSYNLAMAISVGKKCFAWFSFYENQNVCFIMELNKDKKISRINVAQALFHDKLCIGTVLYGSLIELVPNAPNVCVFLVEDIYMYCGIPLKTMCFGERFGFVLDMFKQSFVQRIPAETIHVATDKQLYVSFAMPQLWSVNETYTKYDTIPNHIAPFMAYSTHHIQYRAMHKVAPYVNVPISKPTLTQKETFSSIKIPEIFKPYYCDFRKPQYNYPTIFSVRADMQFDVYHLYTFGKHKSLVYYNVAGIQTYQTSKFMNSLFRKIRENTNLDYIEESEDEDDFQDLREDKYVDLNKQICMECVFHPKIKLWVPVKVVDPSSMVVHIGKL